MGKVAPMARPCQAVPDGVGTGRRIDPRTVSAQVRSANETKMDAHTDILIAGAGPAGLSLAYALKHRLGALASVTVCDPGLAEAGTVPDAGRPVSLRAVALAPDVRSRLEVLGLWSGLADGAEPVVRMDITDSRLGAQPNPVYLTFAAPAGGALAHIVFAAELRAAILAACRRAGVRFEAAALGGLVRQPHGVTALDAAGGRREARLLVAADGGRSRLRHAAGFQTVGHGYGQSGIAATLGHAEPHGGRAVQHFLPGGPLALLPLAPDRDGTPRSSLVWTERTAEAARLVALPGPAFLAELEARMGPGLGQLDLKDAPRAFPLRLELARRLTAGRVALLGDAARVIHPLAGQGLNLGLRDAAALADAVGGAMELGLDPAGPDVMRRYARARSFDAASMAAMTDGLNRLFSNDSLPLRTLRDIGLGLVDRAPAAKRLFISGATGVRRAS